MRYPEEIQDIIVEAEELFGSCGAAGEVLRWTQGELSLFSMYADDRCEELASANVEVGEDMLNVLPSLK